MALLFQFNLRPENILFWKSNINKIKTTSFQYLFNQFKKKERKS